MVALNTLITFVVVAIIAILIFRVLGWALAPFIGNIIAGGLLYWLIDAMLMKFPWTFLDAIIVALFGIPGTIVIAICRALF
ncbi:MAG: ABC transporter permease [Negativicoccus succinicivorans]|nr:ABC transporter permease [Negativicoccus succinicivorans]